MSPEPINIFHRENPSQIEIVSPLLHHKSSLVGVSGNIRVVHLNNLHVCVDPGEKYDFTCPQTSSIKCLTLSDTGRSSSLSSFVWSCLPPGWIWFNLCSPTLYFSYSFACSRVVGYLVTCATVNILSRHFRHVRCCFSRKGRSMRRPPSWTIHQMSMLPCSSSLW